MNNNSIIGIKSIENSITLNGIMIIRKYYNNEIPISEIKAKIESNDYIAVCDYIDKEGIEKILQLYDKLAQEGIKCDLYEHDTKTTLEFLNNLLNSYSETEREVELDMDKEAEYGAY